MAEPKAFQPVKLICGIMAREESFFKAGEEGLVGIFGPIDLRSPLFPFDLTEYYARDMGLGLTRMFVSFERLVGPERLSEMKLLTNGLEESLQKGSGSDHRVINLDPGYLTASALIMATAKAFSHRVPLRDGIYAHLEFLFTKSGMRFLEWTYPDIRNKGYQGFFVEARKTYLRQNKRV